VRAFSASPAPAESVRAAIFQDLGQLFGASETPERCLEFILQITSSDENAVWQPGALAGLARGLQGRGAGSKDRSALMTLLTGDSPEARLASQRVAAALKHATAVAVDHIAPTSSRLGAIGLLGLADYSRTGDTLEGLLTPQHSGEIQVAAVRALSQMPEPSAVAALLGRTRWASFTPEVREAALAALTRDEARTLMLLDAIEEDTIPGTTLTAARRNRLTNHRNPAIQKRARTLLAPFESGNRMQAYERLRGAVLSRQGFDESGKRVFTTYCANCHSFKGSGGTLGPDLSGIRNQPAEAILLHVLVPDYEITPGYYAYVVETKDGRTLVGRLQSETPNGVTLQDASGQQHVVLRGQIASMTASPNSLMPNELERAMSEQDLADVIRYLKDGAGSKQTERH
jgi:putative heme-binding domain-containing protein